VQGVDSRSRSPAVAPPPLTAVNGARIRREIAEKCLQTSCGARISGTKILTWNNFA
jgi:hypothetical protein